MTENKKSIRKPRGNKVVDDSITSDNIKQLIQSIPDPDVAVVQYLEKPAIKDKVKEKNKKSKDEINKKESEKKEPEQKQSYQKEVEIISKTNEFHEEEDVEDNDNNDDGSMKTKRRGRKPKDKFKFESTDLDEYARNNKKDDNVIIKLPLSCLKLNEEFAIGKDLFPYNPNITTPKPYDPEKGNIGFSLLDDNGIDNEDIDSIQNQNNNQKSADINKGNDNLTSINASISKCNECECRSRNIDLSAVDKKQPNETRQIDIILNNKYYTNTDKFNVLTHLGNSMNGDKWPEKVDIPCFWECHTFKNTPWGVPYKFTNGKFQLFGNFCSANCVLAYILQNYQEDDAMWDKIALLNLLYFKVAGEYKNIVPSFDKMALKLFGGTLEIDEYRNIIGANDKAYGVEFPPCNTIIPMLEEIYKKTNLNNTFIPVDKSRLQTANNELKLKRSKPVVNHKNTLDFCLGNTT
jgi:hypothetical protein